MIAATLLFRPAAHLLALRAAVRVEASVGSSAADEARKIVSLRVSARALADERQLFAEEQEPGGAAAVRAERAERGARAKRPRASKVPVYKPFGRIPADFDAATVERLIARRVQARLKRHYNEADRLQQRVLRLGVRRALHASGDLLQQELGRPGHGCVLSRLDDRRRTWSVQKGWARRRDAVAAADAASVRRQHELESEVEQRIRQLFSFWDADGSGRLDRSEFRLVLQVPRLRLRLEPSRPSISRPAPPRRCSTCRAARRSTTRHSTRGTATRAATSISQRCRRRSGRTQPVAARAATTTCRWRARSLNRRKAAHAGEGAGGCLAVGAALPRGVHHARDGDAGRLCAAGDATAMKVGRLRRESALFSAQWGCMRLRFAAPRRPAPASDLSTLAPIPDSEPVCV